MADWYVSSAVYATTPVWTATTAYTVGQLVRPVAPSFSASFTYRCTTAGTSAATEPSWPANNNATVTNGTAVFTNVSGQSAYGWAAAAGTLYTMQGVGINRVNSGDRVFISSDHSETFSSFTSMTFGQSGSYALVQIISVNRAGSVPPVPADIQSGASITDTNNTFTLDPYTEMYYSGITFNCGTGTLRFAGASFACKNFYFKNCTLIANSFAWLSGVRVIWDNTTVQFATTGGYIGGGNNERCDLLWINTPNAIQGAIVPNFLFSYSFSNSCTLVTMRGVDLSALTTTLENGGSNWVAKILLESCRIAPGLKRYTPDTSYGFNGEVELVNCWDGTSVINERWNDVGNISTDRNIYMSSGAQDDIGNYSFKALQTLTTNDFLVSMLDCFAFDVESTTVGVLKTATVEIMSSLGYTNRDVQLLLEYMGSVASPITSFTGSLSSPLLTATALPTSSATWNIGSAMAWNPADTNNSNWITYSNSNLTITASNGSVGTRANFATNTGKMYWEQKINVNGGGTYNTVGIGLATVNLSFSGNTTGMAVVVNAGTISVNNVNPGPTLGALGTNTIGVAVDFGAKLIWFRFAPSGNWNNSGTANPATGVGGVDITSISTGALLYPLAVLHGTGGDSQTANFGASAFVGAVPSGFASGFVPTLSKQQVQVSFTPQRAGSVRGLVRLTKPATVWINPQVTIT